MINLTKDCCTGSLLWKHRIKEVQKTKPDDFIFSTDIIGEIKLSDVLKEFDNKAEVKEEIINNLEHYARFDVASIYKMMKDKGFK